MTTQRTDEHRVGAIIPANYTYILSYSLATSYMGWPVPSHGVNCELDRSYRDKEGVYHAGEHNPDGFCCIIGLGHIVKAKFASHGGTGNCTVCGSNFIYGDVWKHEPSGEYIHVGHICADKYSMLTDRSAFELAMDRLRQAAATEILKAQNKEKREKFLNDHQGLEEALKTNHYIVVDIANRFQKWATLTEKQVALVFKLHKESITPKPVEPPAGPAPSGRVKVSGTVLATKTVESNFGYGSRYGSPATTLKMLVKLENFSKVWVTVPSRVDVRKGDRISLTATFTVSKDDPGFAYGKRPVVTVLPETPTPVEATSEVTEVVQ